MRTAIVMVVFEQGACQEAQNAKLLPGRGLSDVT